MNRLNPKEQAILAGFLEDYAERLSNDGCNDWKFPKNWTSAERNRFMKEYHEWNGDPEEFEPEKNPKYFQNDCAVALLAAKLRGEDGSEDADEEDEEYDDEDE